MKSIVLSICFSFSLLSFSQVPIKWGKPTGKEIDLKICSFDSTAKAVILSENGSIDFSAGNAYIHIYKKIKILSQQGIQFANIEIPYYYKNNLETIVDIEAQTINIENGVISKTELKKSDFYTKIDNSRWSEIRFTFPSVKEGSILEYKYTLITQRIAFLDSWIFQHQMPTIYSEIKVRFPPTLKYSILIFGDMLKSKYNGKENIDNLWVLNNIPGYENEKNVFCYEDYVEKLRFQLQSYEVWETGAYAKHIYDKDVLISWDKLAEDISEEYTKYLNRTGKVKEVLDTIMNDSDSREAKIQKIYKFVKSGITWTKDYYIFTEKSLTELLNSKQGNSAEINLLTCLLLTEAGINAYPVLISTKSHGKVTKDYPLLEQFNHIIVAIQDDNGYKYIDGINSDKNCYLIPYEDCNYSGFLLDKKNGKWIDIKYPTDSKENRSITCKFDSSGVHMEILNKYSGYFASNRQNIFTEQNVRQPETINLIGNTIFKKDSSGIQNQNIENSNFSENLYYSSKFQFPDKIYFNLNSNDFGNPYKQKDRLFPIELDFPYSKQIRYSIIIPKGYIPEILPKNIAFSLPNKAGKFIYNITYMGNQLSIFMAQDINISIMPREYYDYLREFYNQIILKMNEPIVLEKKI